MKIAVCVKEVPDPAAPRRIDPQSLRLDRSGEGALNPWDLSAIEESLRIVESGGGEVVVLTLGPERVAAALERENADLVLFGQQGADSDGAVLWAAVAERLRLPLISQAASLQQADGSVTVKRQTEYGYDVITAPLPCVVAVSDAINEPRYPSLKGIMGAKKKQQDTLSLGDLKLSAESAGEAGSRTVVLALSPPPARGESTLIEDDGSGAERILDYLVDQKLV
jgi:electron transfer flavoprotein beta subunit